MNAFRPSKNAYLEVQAYEQGMTARGGYAHEIVLHTAHDGSPRKFEGEHPSLFRHLAGLNSPQLVRDYLTLERDLLSRRLVKAIIKALRERLSSVLILSVTQHTPRGLIDPNREVVPNEHGVIPAVRPCLSEYPDTGEIASILGHIEQGHGIVDSFMDTFPTAVLGDIHTMWSTNPKPGRDALPNGLEAYKGRFLLGAEPRPDNLVLGGQEYKGVFTGVLPSFVVNEPYGKPEHLPGIQAGNWLKAYEDRVICADIPKGNMGVPHAPGSVDFDGHQPWIDEYARQLAEALIHLSRRKRSLAQAA